MLALIAFFVGQLEPRILSLVSPPIILNSRDEDGLVLAPGHHALEGALGDGEDVGRYLVPPLADVDLHGPLGVDGKPLGRKY